MQDDRSNKPSAAAFYRTRANWLDYLNTLATVSHAEFRVAFFIAMRMNGKDQCSWWEVKEIAKQIGCSTNTVSDATMKLEQLGLMIVLRAKRGGNRYYIRMPYHLETH
jgi:DNA-binding MarR family transcriptional regulator